MLTPQALQDRAEQAVGMLERCTLCPRACGVNRLQGTLGECRTGRLAMVASAHLHFGEESPLVGLGGSGTIFFAQCNLRCMYCQNHDISAGDGRELDALALAAVMLKLQQAGACNINLVSPSHVVPQLLEAICIAVDRGLQLPIVYNTGGYDAVKTLELLEGVIDIYMPDAKYGDDEIGQQLSGVVGYASVNRAALQEMHRQVGDLQLDARGLAQRGMLVRHLVLPDGLAGTPGVMAHVAGLSRDTYVNVMDQYRPCHRAQSEPRLGRCTAPAEHASAMAAARAAGLHRFA